MSSSSFKIYQQNVFTNHMEIYKAFCLDVAQGHMKGAPNDHMYLIYV